MTRIALPMLLAVSLGCSEEELTQIMVVVDTNIPGVDRVAIEVDASAIDDSAPESFEARISDGPPLTFGIVHRGGPLGPLRVVVTTPDEPDVAREAEVYFVRGEVRVLRMDLFAECVGRSCLDGQTCAEQGECRSIRVEEDELSPWDGDADGLDASIGADGGDRDAGLDAGDAAAPDGCVESLETCNGMDDDCDGAIDEDFDLNTTDDCGACGRACMTGEACVAGACESDPVSLAAGDRHTCALASDGSVWCWGWNGSGQLGGATTSDSPTPLKVSTLPGPAIQLAAGPSHTCARLVDGDVWCWGSDGDGRLGNGPSEEGPGPSRVGLPMAAEDLGLGNDSSCALLADGSVWCWGKNDAGQLGDGTTDSAETPVEVNLIATVTDLAAGGQHVCAVDDGGRVHCWGSSSSGQAGASSGTVNPPAMLDAPTDVVQLAGGAFHTCALDSAGQVWCWGRNDEGQLGRGSGSDGPTAQRVRAPGSTSFMSDGLYLASGASHSCAILAGGRAACWGDDDYGQLGRGMTSDRRIAPVFVEAPLHHRRMAAGSMHTCSRVPDGRVFCWGANGSGQLGDGTTEDSLVPVLVTLP